MTFLLGRHATLGHAPPIYFRSTTAVRLPSLAIVQAINLPAVPLPSTRTSYFSAAFMPKLLCCNWDLDAFDFAAIHANGGAREPASLLRNQIRHQARNFFRLTIAGDAGLFRKVPGGFFDAHSVRRRPMIEERLATARHHRTRHHAVDLDPILNALLGEGLGERNDGGVDSSYGSKARLRIESRASRDEHDGAFGSLQS